MARPITLTRPLCPIAWLAHLAHAAPNQHILVLAANAKRARTFCERAEQRRLPYTAPTAWSREKSQLLFANGSIAHVFSSAPRLDHAGRGLMFHGMLVDEGFDAGYLADVRDMHALPGYAYADADLLINVEGSPARTNEEIERAVEAGDAWVREVPRASLEGYARPMQEATRRLPEMAALSQEAEVVLDGRKFQTWDDEAARSFDACFGSDDVWDTGLHALTVQKLEEVTAERDVLAAHVAGFPQLDHCSACNTLHEVEVDCPYCAGTQDGEEAADAARRATEFAVKQQEMLAGQLAARDRIITDLGKRNERLLNDLTYQRDTARRDRALLITHQQQHVADLTRQRDLARADRDSAIATKAENTVFLLDRLAAAADRIIALETLHTSQGAPLKRSGASSRGGATASASASSCLITRAPKRGGASRGRWARSPVRTVTAWWTATATGC